jgi:hypothetical protein
VWTKQHSGLKGIGRNSPYPDDARGKRAPPARLAMCWPG